jgi:hypothetical protein
MRLLLLGAAVAALAAGSAAAQTRGPVAIGAQIGTTGVGAELQFQATPMITLRAGGDFFEYDENAETSDYDYDAQLDFSTLSGFVDLHPFQNPFFLSAGVYLGQRGIAVTGRPNRDVVIAGTVFPPPAFGTLVGEADFGDAAPFAGLGWNNTFHTAGPIGFKIVAGATFGSDPTVELRREGGTALPPAIQAQFDAEVEQEEAELERELEDFKVLPVLQVGLTYRF